MNQSSGSVIAAPHASFASYHTFSFGLSDPPKAGYEVTARSLEVQRRLRLVVLAALQQRGYALEDAGGDFIVKLAAGTGPAVYIATQGHDERATDSGLAQGFVGISVYDRATGNEVWQASAFAEISPAKIDDSLLQMGVNHMLKDFPARQTEQVAAAH
ncbi:MAG: DUF4136 domain-containing protein [Polyangiaceae bacterium]